MDNNQIVDSETESIIKKRGIVTKKTDAVSVDMNSLKSLPMLSPNTTLPTKEQVRRGSIVKSGTFNQIDKNGAMSKPI